MIIKESALRLKIRSLLLEERVYKIKELLEDITFYRDFEEGEFEQIEQRLRSNWDRGYSKFSQVIKKDVINTEEPVEHILDAIDSFMPFYSSVGPRMTQQIGQGKLSSSDLRTFVESQTKDSLDKFRTEQRIKCRKQVPILEGQECNDFKVIHAGDDWTVVYPKTILGSMSWAVGLADGEEETYSIGSDGRQIGRVGWCTASYSNNRFSMYAGNLHMYYFVKNTGYKISDRNRRLCVSWSKNENTGRVKIHHEGNATVNARNASLSEKKLLSLIGNELIEKMIADASSRKATSLSEMASKVTLSMIKQDIENLKDDPETLKQQLYIYAENSKDEEVIRFFAEYKDDFIRRIISSRSDLPEELLEQLTEIFVKDENAYVRNNIAIRSDLPEELIVQFAKDKDEIVRFNIAAKKDLSKYERIFEDVIEQLAKDKAKDVRFITAGRNDLPEKFMKLLAKDKHKHVRSVIASRSDLPEYLVKKLAKDRSAFVRSDIARRKSLPEDVIRRLAEDKVDDIKFTIALRKDLPKDLKDFFAENYPEIVGESRLLRKYIGLLLN